ncbi:MAG: helix-turn-helix transcriptional regulator [Lachnospiraceae bacterium]|nr:helix-turn-helix transcriptional regulator [Lachnospiraceae bacterium]
MDFGDRLKLLRTQAGLTQKQLAERIGATKSMISYYELQERQPSSVSLRKLSEVFHVSTDYLLGLEKGESIDVSGLNEEDIQLVRHLVSVLREKNRKKS